MKILIYRMGAFGDTLLLALLCKQLRNHYESAQITLAANPNYAAPLLDSGLIHEILNGGSPPFHLMYNEPSLENDALSQIIGHYSMCMFYTSDISGEFTRRLHSSKLDNCLIHPPLPPASEAIHTSEWMMRPWKSLDAGDFKKITLKPSQNNLLSANKVLNEHGITDVFFSIHSGGGGKKKMGSPSNSRQARTKACR